MTKNEIEIKKSYNLGKVEAFKILYGHTKDSRHKKFLDNAEDKVKELQGLLDNLEKPGSDTILGMVEFHITVNGDGTDFSISTEQVISEYLELTYGTIPAALAISDYLMLIANMGIKTFKEVGDEGADNLAFRLNLLYRMLAEWSQHWAKALLELHRDKDIVPSQIITDLSKENFNG